jgi:hypothetical protein
MKLRKGKPFFFSDTAELRAPRFLPGDPVLDIDDPGEIGIVEFARSDGNICLRWPSGRKEWLHESRLMWAPGFTPLRRR